MLPDIYVLLSYCNMFLEFCLYCLSCLTSGLFLTPIERCNVIPSSSSAGSRREHASTRAPPPSNWNLKSASRDGGYRETSALYARGFLCGRGCLLQLERGRRERDSEAPDHKEGKLHGETSPVIVGKRHVISDSVLNMDISRGHRNARACHTLANQGCTDEKRHWFK